MIYAHYHLRCETATFLHGARNREEAEKRSTAFKSAARYWFRAAIGNIQHDVLLDLEGRIFGSNDYGKGLVYHLPVVDTLVKNAKSLLPHHGQETSKSPALLRETKLELLVNPARRCACEEQLEIGVAALWIALNLGGVGQRSRRGAGSISIDSVEPPALFIESLKANTIEEYAGKLSFGLRKAIGTIRKLTGTEQTARGNAAFPTLDGARIQTIKLAAKEEEKARTEIIQGLREFKDPAFGLPYMKPATGQQQINGRHASPLWIHLAQIEGTWIAVQTRLGGPIPTHGNGKMLENYLNNFGNAVQVSW